MVAILGGLYFALIKRGAAQFVHDRSIERIRTKIAIAQPLVLSFHVQGFGRFEVSFAAFKCPESKMKPI